MTDRRVARFSPLALLLTAVLLLAAPATADVFHFQTDSPDGRMAAASRPPAAGTEIEAADDFVLTDPTTIQHATFTGLVTGSGTIGEVTVEIYRVFPLDSTNPPSGQVPTRTNSPSDIAFKSADSAASTLTFSTATLAPTFMASNSVLNGIHPIPGQTTGGEGPVTGQEVMFTVTFNPPLVLPLDHYFFVPQVQVTGGQFYWLSAQKPISAAGTPFTGDLQSWIRNAALDPDWLRIGTDIVGGATPPTFNAAFSLDGTTGFLPSVPALSTPGLLALALLLAGTALFRLRRRSAPAGC
ncbi:MAG TPA: PEP-CTERM sorting domain-containing protein [Thermoanaerobaculia bacterium]|jgi:hypothetical protein